VLLPLAHLRAADFERLGIDVDAALARAAKLRATPDLAERVRRVFAAERQLPPADADAALYDGFASDADRRACLRVRSSSVAGLAALEAEFGEGRYRELLFRYRARNWPQSLSADERARWDDYRRRRLGSIEHGLSEYDFTTYRAEIASLRAQHGPGPAQPLLDALQAWGEELEASLA
jgi:exodeoxyribonuclease-1